MNIAYNYTYVRAYIYICAYICTHILCTYPNVYIAPLKAPTYLQYITHIYFVSIDVWKAKEDGRRWEAEVAIEDRKDDGMALPAAAESKHYIITQCQDQIK